ncbi:hypothetical protein ALQ08_104482 [Pseudomonas syringae pv. delphinii]|uniref:Uncharacterized protein n=1 Tax=Pseudomonas syringae pv. delphinii TaxID=192088 RepID=A0A0P9PSB7_9PSED|nr:hypothetical protein ALO72_103684 [Pseudomonas syringae pv. delphinii]RMP14500.1 hypothetical protein ALQ28_104273 [Pseudomonas syringae pv. delphinii]RMP19825.1 hypothetical protein ALQ27_104557 [Pseudomonas syringae pv. delphinii]RMQ17891.1 hypothetical protein ALQ08_104482 [Pseudomonas syringae pv. delphinii]
MRAHRQLANKAAVLGHAGLYAGRALNYTAIKKPAEAGRFSINTIPTSCQ